MKNSKKLSTMSKDHKNLLGEAMDIASNTIVDRDNLYGDPMETYGRISDMISLFVNEMPVTTLDAISIEILKKLIRIQRSPDQPDSWVDIIGYAACGYSISERYNGRG